MEGERYFIFQAEYHANQQEWQFQPMEVSIGLKDEYWLEIKPHAEMRQDMLVAWNNAYYLLAEMQKGEAQHQH
jgi:cobalt-zinc-cadmium efflux system membrane fusion protein